MSSKVSQLQTVKDHRANRLFRALDPASLAYLEPHLEVVTLQRGDILYETDENIRYTYFPHDAVVALVAVMENGASAEMVIVGREGLVGLWASDSRNHPQIVRALCGPNPRHGLTDQS